MPPIPLGCSVVPIGLIALLVLAAICEGKGEVALVFVAIAAVMLMVVPTIDEDAQ